MRVRHSEPPSALASSLGSRPPPIGVPAPWEATHATPPSSSKGNMRSRKPSPAPAEPTTLCRALAVGSSP